MGSSTSAEADESPHDTSDVSVLVTMDVEPVKQDPNWTGPEDAETSERLIRAYHDIAHSHGFPVSFFIHPEAAELHAELFHDLADQGDCLGLHLHPIRFQHPRYDRELGFYTGDQQHEILSRAKQCWSEAMGEEPAFFRPGAFSANDASFPTLVKLGFRGGSLSIPGRVWPERYSVWAGACLDPHRANASFRQVAGDLPFANIPLSVDTTSVVGTQGFTCYRDLRPNARDVPVEETLRNIMAGLAERRPAVPVVHLVTHNDQPFDDPDSESTRRLEALLRSVGPVCRELGMRAIGHTVSHVCDRVLATPPQRPTEWRQPNEVSM